ncbi:MAG: SLBB domain-containing protein [Candidatus Eremiobacteraeota bacterium]|nr:SLBB domain-containing protein [Candidatus Eremiobacteraeota bacterium]
MLILLVGLGAVFAGNRTASVVIGLLIVTLGAYMIVRTIRLRNAAARGGLTVSTWSNQSVRSLAAVAMLAVLPFAPWVAQAQSNPPASAPAAPATPTAENGATSSAVPAKTIRVQVLGTVSRPGNVDLKDGDRLLTALTRAGIAAPLRPDLSRIVLVRVDPVTGKTPSYVIDVYQVLRHGDQRYDPILRADDKIYVPEARPMFRAPLQIATFEEVGYTIIGP